MYLFFFLIKTNFFWLNIINIPYHLCTLANIMAIPISYAENTTTVRDIFISTDN